MDDELSAHRTRINRRPEPPCIALEQAVNAIFEQPIEDKQ